MSVYIHHIETSVPTIQGEQRALLDRLKKIHEGDRKTQAILHRIYQQSGIENRHTVIEDYFSEDSDSFFNRCFNPEAIPTTGERNQRYEQAAKELFLKTAEQLIKQQKTAELPEITHVITVSCTGFFAPGPDYEIVKKLGLPSSTQRFHVGFMGCYAAFPALRMAHAFCAQDPNAVVLIVATELCSLHFSPKTDPDTLIAGSVFSDGSAGALVSAIKPKGKGFELKGFANDLAYEGEQDMAWTIGDTGFDMTLSSYVPDIIKQNLSTITDRLFTTFDIRQEHILDWAIHPGGRAILDKVEQNLDLDSVQIQASRKVLQNYGNMSSATILFVLKELLEADWDHRLPLEQEPKLEQVQKPQDEQDPELSPLVLAMAFGPGLSIESALLAKVKG